METTLFVEKTFALDTARLVSKDDWRLFPNFGVLVVNRRVEVCDDDVSLNQCLKRRQEKRLNSRLFEILLDNFVINLDATLPVMSFW